MALDTKKVHFSANHLKPKLTRDKNMNRLVNLALQILGLDLRFTF